MLYHRCRTTFIILALAFLLGFTGCEEESVETVAVEKGPSYADLVVTYNAELSALDRLELKREKLVAEFAAANIPAAPQVSGQLEELLKAASGLAAESGELDPNADPNELLDQLAERNGSAQDLASQLLEGLGGDQAEAADGDEAPGPAEVAKAAEPTPAEVERESKYHASLAALDKEIADQKVRVGRARAARDAASSVEP